MAGLLLTGCVATRSVFEQAQSPKKPVMVVESLTHAKSAFRIDGALEICVIETDPSRKQAELFTVSIPVDAIRHPKIWRPRIRSLTPTRKSSPPREERPETRKPGYQPFADPGSIPDYQVPVKDIVKGCKQPPDGAGILPVVILDRPETRPRGGPAWDAETTAWARRRMDNGEYGAAIFSVTGDNGAERFFYLDEKPIFNGSRVVTFSPIRPYGGGPVWYLLLPGAMFFDIATFPVLYLGVGVTLVIAIDNAMHEMETELRAGKVPAQDP